MTRGNPKSAVSAAPASGLRWKINRLRTMGWAEVASRVRHAVQARLEARGFGLVRTVPVLTGAVGQRWIAVVPAIAPEDATACLAAAEEILAGRFNVFALRGVALGFPPQWLRDPRTGTLAPLTFGKALNYRDESIVGDIKYLWEPSRHLELVTLAQAWHSSGEARFADAARTLLESWFADNPYPLGPHWTSSLEHAVRLVNWSVAWQIFEARPSAATAAGSVFDGAQGRAFRQRWLEEVYRHCHFIAGHFSQHSSANNHLLGEYMGLHIASITWPCWPASARWQALAHAGFEREALLQNGTDGVNREQGIWYHHEVADMMLLCGLAARATGADFSAPYWQRLEAMLGFLCAMMSASGEVPMIGDSDDAVMVRFSVAPAFDPYRSLLASGAALFGRADFAAKAGRFDGKSCWLLGTAGEAAFDRLQAEPPPPRDPDPAAGRVFEQGGYWILGDALDTPREVRLIADAGPLGYLSIAAHGHADALAFTLSVAGRELLIDPGTYAYHTQREWRDYFKGTSAHNTVRIDGQDQSVSGGNFMWLRHARARCLHAVFGPARDEWRGMHDGYHRLADPVTHTREIVLDKARGEIRVTDEIACKGEHEVELFWHFSERCEVRLADGGTVASNDSVSVTLRMPGSEWQPELVSGREEPPLGWISRSFDEKVPTFTAVWCGRVAGTKKLVTLLTLAGRPAEPASEAWRNDAVSSAAHAP